MWKSLRLVYKKFVPSFHQTKEEIGRVVEERDAAHDSSDDIAVLQVQTDAQLAALTEQYDQEGEMLVEKLSVLIHNALAEFRWGQKKLDPSPSAEDGVSILELGELQEVVLDISVTNTGESAYEAGLYVSHPRSLSFMGRVS
ncbi:hypothetical protein DAPPUDRAFT_314100 [Daphnia pulex]|uniref:Integrin alpha second immunoglobulin-like domain-containing protein n=1 Tax=Daphnia pulex TaxID=6669 RepID=E9G4P2_DAPPU|nr:hypothetical protein DAPPUDRAFT_314097 [Daphnia pulex]EFX85524.1 hypothetical protein DAPPUDRAFT_314100 [Daphnia pulex]|eukprot:EFX85336.1 hypothetical protein DAPPUDRAFT_314097 [Daphnia pulex]